MNIHILPEHIHRGIFEIALIKTELIVEPNQVDCKEDKGN